MRLKQQTAKACMPSYVSTLSSPSLRLQFSKISKMLENGPMFRDIQNSENKTKQTEKKTMGPIFKDFLRKSNPSERHIPLCLLLYVPCPHPSSPLLTEQNMHQEGIWKIIKKHYHYKHVDGLAVHACRHSCFHGM